MMSDSKKNKIEYRALSKGRLSFGDVNSYRWKSIRPLDLAEFVFISLATTGVSMLIPMLTKALTGGVIDNGSLTLLAGVLIFMLTSALASQLLEVVKTMTNDRLKSGSRLPLESAMMERMLTLPLSVSQKYGTGELRERMDSVVMLSDLFIDVIVLSTVSLLSSMMFVFQIGHYASSLILPSIIVLVLTLILSLVTTYFQTGVSRKYMAIETKKIGAEYETVNLATKLKQAGAQERALTRWKKLYDDAAGFKYRPPMILRIEPALLTAIKMGGTVVFYWLAAKSGMEASDYLAFTAAYGGLTAAFSSVATIARSVSRVMPIYDMARPVMETECVDDEKGEDVGELNGDIRIEDLTFRYSEDKPCVIKDFSLDIHAGECIGISGPTGCGKTTLLRLILGLITPESGTIRYDGRELSNLSLSALRKHMGVVIQDGRLFGSDIYSNVTMAHPGLSEDDVWKALKTAHLDDDIKALPLGIFSKIYENNRGISGGQKQRLLIAQAIAHHPRIIILDEATSALDAGLEEAIMRDLKALGCTMIVVAHRKSALVHCDRVIEL